MKDFESVMDDILVQNKIIGTTLNKPDSSQDIAVNEIKNFKKIISG